MFKQFHGHAVKETNGIFDTLCEEIIGISEVDLDEGMDVDCEECKKVIGRKVIAVDFDGILCSNAYPEIGAVRMQHLLIHNYIQEEHQKGSIIILWTCRCGDYLHDAVEACKKWGVPIDYVNENDPERIAFYGVDSRKVSADIYIDDKAVNPLVKLEV